MATGQLLFSRWRERKPSPETEPETEEGPGPQLPVKEEPITGEEPEMMTKTKKEFTINKPTPFDGNRKSIQSFMQECQVYLHVNRHVYTTDNAKVAFVLSYMNEKEALTWKENYLWKITDADGELKFPADILSISMASGSLSSFFFSFWLALLLLPLEGFMFFLSPAILSIISII